MDDYPTDPRRDKPLDFYKDAPSVRDAPGAREGLSCCAQAALLCGFTIVFVPLALAWAFSAFIGDGDTGLLVLICEVLVYFAGLFWILKSGKK